MEIEQIGLSLMNRYFVNNKLTCCLALNLASLSAESLQ